jgi:hypothetical protein
VTSPSATHQDESHIHRVGDGRGMRHVYLNGHKLKYVTYANEKTGEVTFLREPIEFEFGAPFSCTAQGHVEVFFEKQ